MNASASEQVQELHNSLLSCWNSGNAQGFAALFANECLCIGFDGTTYTTAKQIATELEEIFTDHQVASYVHKTRSITVVDERTILLHAVAGMTPPGSTKVNPDRNAVQVLLARRTNNLWQIVSFQNTPAKYDGRPETVQALTEELQRLIGKK